MRRDASRRAACRRWLLERDLDFWTFVLWLTAAIFALELAVVLIVR